MFLFQPWRNVAPHKVLCSFKPAFICFHVNHLPSKIQCLHLPEAPFGGGWCLHAEAGGPAPRGPPGAPDLPAGTFRTAPGNHGASAALRLWRRGDHPMPCGEPVARPAAALLGPAQRGVAAEGDGKLGAGRTELCEAEGTAGRSKRYWLMGFRF